jgi:hypothetical protein
MLCFVSLLTALLPNLPQFSLSNHRHRPAICDVAQEQAVTHWITGCSAGTVVSKSSDERPLPSPFERFAGESDSCDAT